MVRLEKVLYEKLLNNKALGRARGVGAPKKWINHNPIEYNAAQAGYLHDNSITAKFWEKVLYPFYQKFWWEYQRDHALQRGYAMDDFYVHTEKDLRRSPFYEHIWRESTHPYEYLMYKYRRQRYYKVERVIQGFYVPKHLRDEVKKRTWAETLASVEEWTNFVYRNYASDITPTTYDSRGKINLFEVFQQYGLFKNEAWERYFYNEEEYDFVEPEDYERYIVRPGGFDLETNEGRMLFENKINTLMQDFPGLVVPEGESFDFENYYMKWSLLHGKDTSRFDQDKLSAVYNDIKHIVDRTANPEMNLLQDGAEAKTGTNTVGTMYPQRAQEDVRSALQN
jgi:hypothetical protein